MKVLFYMFIFSGLISFVSSLVKMMMNHFRKESLFNECFSFIGVGVFLIAIGFLFFY